MTVEIRTVGKARLLADLSDEINRAVAKFPPFNSGHEGKAVIEEELDELWELVKANDGQGEAARTEALHVAAMAIRYALDVCGG